MNVVVRCGHHLLFAPGSYVIGFVQTMLGLSGMIAGRSMSHGSIEISALGSPTRFGNVSAQLKQFLDGVGPLWFAGELAGKVGTGFTSAGTVHNDSAMNHQSATKHDGGAVAR